MLIRRSISEPIRTCNTWHQRWGTLEDGLVTSWESGRQRAVHEPELAEQARFGHLVLLPFKRGVLKSKKRFAPVFYLAMWQGLRGDDLHVNIEEETEITCTHTGHVVTFTKDSAKYSED